MENVRKRIDVRLLSNKTDYLKRTSKPRSKYIGFKKSTYV